MVTHLLMLLSLLFVHPVDAHALVSTAPDYLTPDRAADHLRAARIAGAVYRVDPDLLLAIAWHESRYTPSLVTNEPGDRVSCGSMTPVPHRPPCSRRELSTLGGYGDGARHLRAWRDLCHGDERCALLAYAGGGWLVEACTRTGHVSLRPGVDGCHLPDMFRAHARAIHSALKTARSARGLLGSEEGADE